MSVCFTKKPAAGSDREVRSSSRGVCTPEAIMMMSVSRAHGGLRVQDDGRAEVPDGWGSFLRVLAGGQADDIVGVPMCGYCTYSARLITCPFGIVCSPRREQFLGVAGGDSPVVVWTMWSPLPQRNGRSTWSYASLPSGPSTRRTQAVPDPRGCSDGRFFRGESPSHLSNR